jgi:hypothetical protein
MGAALELPLFMVAEDDLLAYGGVDAVMHTIDLFFH